MKTRILTLLLLAIATAAQAQFGGGTGTWFNPYRIETTDHMLELAASVNSGNDYLDKHFSLTNDLDFTGIDYTPIGGGIINNDYAVFSGTFNGHGHKILNLRVGCSYHAGIFGQISGGTIEHLTLGGDSRIEGGLCVGGIVGRTGTSSIIDCHVEKTVTIAASKRGSEYIGGIVGAAFDGTSYVAQEIEGCTSAATVTNNGYSNVKYVGGIAGVILSDGQSIRNCKNYGAVSGSSDVGGIVGEFNFNWPGNVLEDCYTGGYCTLYGVGKPGSSQGINLEGKAVSMHTITFGDNVQGNVTTTPTATFEGEKFYAAGMQVSLNIIPDSGTPVGYLPMFYLNAEPKQTGYEIETVMPAENVTVTVDATNLMRDISYSPWVSVSLNQESFDYDGSEQVPEVTVTDIKNGTLVTLTEGIDYEVMPPSNPISPGNYTLTINGIGQFGGKVRVLYAITTPDRWPGLGTADKPYLILTTDHILALADSVNKGKSYIGQYFSLQNDLDFSSKDYVPIGNFNNEFKGTFNGNGHSFNHVVINNDKDYLGLFGNIGEDGSVSGLTLGEGSSIEGSYYIGGIAALCRGTISDCSTAEGVIVKASSLSAGGIAYSLLGGRIANCQNHADVSTKSICGGIAGNNENGEVSGCINYGSVEAGTWIAGGIVGEITQHGIVRDCFNEGTVSSPQNVGGIVGDLGGIIRNCLNLGAVSASNNKNVGGIAGRKSGSLSLSNNYYAGACSVGGINGSDGKGEAMRGYTVSGESGITLGLQGSSGVSYKGDIYAGKGELILIDISVPEGYVPLNGYSASAGTLSTSGTAWRLTMPNEDVVITGMLVLELLDDDSQSQLDNMTRLSNSNDRTNNVRLQGRTLYKTGIWNTICLPFALSSFAGTPLADATVKQLVSSGYNASTGTLTLNFSTVSEIEAGKPYIVRWASGENVENPVFESVTVSSNAVSSVKTDYVDFIGCYSPVSLAAQDRTVLYLGDNSKLYYPSVEVPVNAFRGHFRLKNGLTAGDLPTNGAKNFVLNFGDETTGLTAVESGQLRVDSYYSIDGRRLQGKPTKKGVYIIKGKKVVK